MVFKIGYNNTESESKLYFRYEYKKYNILLNKFLNQNLNNNNSLPLIIDLNIIKSATTTKIGTTLKNILQFKLLDNNIFTLDLDLSSKKKIIKYVNLDILPLIKFTLTNNNNNIELNLKTGKYQGSKEQLFNNNYDYSNILQSLLPYNKSSLSLKYTNDYILYNNILLLYKYKITLNKINNYENNIKGLISLKTIFDINNFNLFTLGISNEIKLRNAIIYKYNKNKNKINNTINSNHITSTYECKSKILNLNINNIDNNTNIINNNDNNTYYIQNNLILKLKDLPFIKQNELLNRINPYIGIETIYPNFRFIYTLGIALQINEYMSIDLSFYTWTNNKYKNNKKDKERDNIINRFRVNLEISTSLD
jgi:hypothetical protein